MGEDPPSMRAGPAQCAPTEFCKSLQLHLPKGAVEFVGGFAVRQNRQQKTRTFEH